MQTIIGLLIAALFLLAIIGFILAPIWIPALALYCLARQEVKRREAEKAAGKQ